MNILVIDVGTSSMRGILFDENGRQLDLCQRTYQLEMPAAGRIEQNPADWTDALTQICTEIAAHTVKKGRKIDALSLTSQRSSILPVDENGNPLSAAIMWQDVRNASIVESFGCHMEQIQERTGARLNTVFSGTKMTWLHRNCPDLYQKAYRICTIADYLIWYMTGAFVTDYTYGSRSLMMDLERCCWDPELLDLFEVEEEKLCHLIVPGSIAGFAKPEFAEKTGLQEGIPLITAGGDQQCGALGQGVFAPGAVEITAGTGAYLLQYSEKPVSTVGRGIVCGAHAVPGAYVLESSMLTCAALYNWAVHTLYDAEDYAQINREVEQTPPGSNGCIALPYFQGRGTPDWNNTARGGFLNVELGTTRGAMARSILEAIAYETENNLEILTACQGQADTVYLGGGLTKQPQFGQILADVTGLPLQIEQNFSEQTARGAWMSAAVRLGIYPDYADAWKRATASSQIAVCTPDETHREIYENGRRAMNHCYAQLYR